MGCSYYRILDRYTVQGGSHHCQGWHYEPLPYLSHMHCQHKKEPQEELIFTVGFGQVLIRFLCKWCKNFVLKMVSGGYFELWILLRMHSLLLMCNITVKIFMQIMVTRLRSKSVIYIFLIVWEWSKSTTTQPHYLKWTITIINWPKINRPTQYSMIIRWWPS